MMLPSINQKLCSRILHEVDEELEQHLISKNKGTSPIMMGALKGRFINNVFNISSH